MRINKKSDLPKWFNMDNYKDIGELPDDEIAYLILCRCNDLMTGGYNKEGYFDNDLYYGKLYLETTPEVKRHEMKISSSRSIKPISIGDFNTFRNDLIYMDVNSDNEAIKYNHLSAYEKDNMSLALWDGVVCSINISTNQDETIIEELKVLLKKWRVELNFKEGQPLINSCWAVIKTKIINYNIFAFFDLHLWQMATGNAITSGVLAVTLYPEGQFDSIQIAQTIKPFSEKLFTFETLEKIEREISNK